jgi:hypothetical protein
MRPSDSLFLIRRLLRRAKQSEDTSLFSLLSVIERKIYAQHRAKPERWIPRTKDAPPKKQRYPALSRYIE